MKENFDTTPIHPIIFQVGAAVQDSQSLELSISFIITLLVDLSGGKLTDDEFEGWMEDLGSKTLGRLIGKIKEKVEFDQAAVDALKGALAARNFLVHRFFNERSELFLNSEGRKKALKEIKIKRRAINTAYEMLDPVAVKLMSMKGISVDQLMSDIHSKFEKDF